MKHLNYLSPRKIRITQLKKKKNPKIAIFRRLGGLGDVIMSLPLCKEIKRHLPRSTIYYCTDTKYANGDLVTIVKHCPHVDKVISSKEGKLLEKQGMFTFVADITSTGLNKEVAGTTPLNRIDLFARQVGLILQDPVPEYIVKQTEKKAAEQLLANLGFFNKKIVVIHVRSNDTRRTWPARHVQALANKLSLLENVAVVLLDWQQDGKWIENNSLRFVKDLDFTTAIALIGMSDLVIAPDSSIIHVAGMTRAKGLGIFGPTPPESRINHYPTVEAITTNFSCMPCWYACKCFKDIKKQHRGKEVTCLSKLSDTVVYNKVISMLFDEQIPDLISDNTKASEHKQDKAVLVLRRTRGIGDMLTAMNSVETFADSLKDWRIDVAIPSALKGIISTKKENIRFISSDKPINHRQYQQIADISSPCAIYESSRVSRNKLVKKTRTEIFGEALGVRSCMEDLKPRLHLTEEEVLFGKKYIENIKKPVVALAPFSNEKYRNWDSNQLTKFLKNNLDTTFVLLHDKKFHFKNIINTDDLTFRQRASVLYAIDVLISIDTVWLHAGAAFNKNIIALFGPIDYRARVRGYDNVKVLVAGQSCSPCWRNGKIKCKLTGSIQHSECMKISHAGVTKALKEIS